MISIPSVERRPNECTRRFIGPRNGGFHSWFFQFLMIRQAGRETHEIRVSNHSNALERIGRSRGARPIDFFMRFSPTCNMKFLLLEGLETCRVILRFFFTPILNFPLENGNQFSMIVSRNVFHVYRNLDKSER